MFRSTLLYLGIFTLFVSIFSLLNILFCYYFDSLLNIKVYFACLLISSLLSAIFIFFNKKYLNEKINFFEKLFLVIIGFFYFPLLISIPYYLSIYNKQTPLGIAFFLLLRFFFSTNSQFFLSLYCSIN